MAYLALSPWHLTRDLIPKTKKETNQPSYCEPNEGLELDMCTDRRMHTWMDGWMSGCMIDREMVEWLDIKLGD